MSRNSKRGSRSSSRSSVCSRPSSASRGSRSPKRDSHRPRRSAALSARSLAPNPPSTGTPPSASSASPRLAPASGPGANSEPAAARTRHRARDPFPVASPTTSGGPPPRTWRWGRGGLRIQRMLTQADQRTTERYVRRLRTRWRWRLTRRRGPRLVHVDRRGSEGEGAKGPESLTDPRGFEPLTSGSGGQPRSEGSRGLAIWRAGPATGLRLSFPAAPRRRRTAAP